MGLKYDVDGGCRSHYGPLHLDSVSRTGRLTRGMRPKKAKPENAPIGEESTTGEQAS